MTSPSDSGTNDAQDVEQATDSLEKLIGYTVRLQEKTSALLHALVSVEWGGCHQIPYDGCVPCCAYCIAPMPGHSPADEQCDITINPQTHHEVTCILDAALTAMGLTTQAKRNEAREG